MNCVKCFHYEACQSVDVTGYVTDREKTSEEACEHFTTHNDVHPSAHWKREVRKYGVAPGGDVYINYKCSHCHGEHKGSIKSFKIKEWNEYWAEHYTPDHKFFAYCHECGAKMNLDETDHANWVAIR